MKKPSLQSMEEIIRKDGRYPPQAYAFLHDGLAQAVEKAYGKMEAKPKQKHVGGRDLCLALRDLAIERWGRLARTVLAKWNIRETVDFGNMVYLLIEHGFMGKTEDDSIEHFRDVYSFGEAFDVADTFEIKE